MFKWLKTYIEKLKVKHIHKQIETNNSLYINKVCKNCLYSKIHNNDFITENDTCSCLSVTNQCINEEERYYNSLITGNNGSIPLRKAITICKTSKWQYKYFTDVENTLIGGHLKQYVCEVNYDSVRYREIIFVDISLQDYKCEV